MKESWLEAYKKSHQHPFNRATHMVGIPLVMLSLPTLFVRPWWGLGMFVLGWTFQIIGHAVEGKPPAFLRNPYFLLVGATWYLRKITGRLDSNPTEKIEP